MKKFLFIILYLYVTQLVLNAQFIELGHYELIENSESPQSDIMQNGIGNLGFDNKFSSFNPTFDKEMNQFYYSGGMVINKNYSRDGYLQYYEDPFPRNRGNKQNYSGDFIVATKMRKYQLFITSYYTKILNAVESHDKHDSYYTLNQKNRVLQFCLIRKLNDKSSISLSAITNKFNSSYVFHGQSSNRYYELAMDYFNQLQFAGSYNISLNDAVKSYVSFKTQNSLMSVTPDLYHEFHNDAVISYPGYLALGIQYKLNDRLKLSLESKNEFLYADKKIKIKDLYLGDYTMQYKHETINSMIAVGINSEIIPSIQAGILYSQFINYDNQAVSLEKVSPKRSDYNLSDPYYINISLNYELHNFNLTLHYQLSEVDTKLYYETSDGWAMEGEVTEKADFLRISIGYNN